MADPTAVPGDLNPTGGGTPPVHATQFQVVLDPSDLTLVFMNRSFAYKDSTTPTVSTHIAASISLSHIMAKDLSKVLVRAIADFEKQYGKIPLPTSKKL